jgi:hypothetical protein
MSGPIADFLQMKDSFGLPWALFILACLAIIYLLYMHFRDKAASIKERSDKGAETLDLLRKSIVLDSGQSISIIDLADVMEKLSLEFFRNCENCVVHRQEVSELAKEFAAHRKHLDEVSEEGKQSRAILQEALRNLQDAVKTMDEGLDRLSVQIISTLKLALKVPNRED